MNRVRFAVADEHGTDVDRMLDVNASTVSDVLDAVPEDVNTSAVSDTVDSASENLMESGDAMRDADNDEDDGGGGSGGFFGGDGIDTGDVVEKGGDMWNRSTQVAEDCGKGDASNRP